MPSPSPIFKNIDCVRLTVPDLDAALEFYCRKMGQKLIWRTESAAGVGLGEGGCELVLTTEAIGKEIDLLVQDVEAAVRQIETAGGKVLAGPFEIQIGRCAVVQDPWGNELVVLDMSKGRLVTDSEGKILGNEAPVQ